MTDTEMMERLREVMARDLQLEVPAVLRESDRLHEDLRVDSLMVLQLIVLLEDRFGLEVPEEEVDPAVFGTVGSLVAFIRRLAEAAA